MLPGGVGGGRYFFMGAFLLRSDKLIPEKIKTPKDE